MQPLIGFTVPLRGQLRFMRSCHAASLRTFICTASVLGGNVVPTGPPPCIGRHHDRRTIRKFAPAEGRRRISLHFMSNSLRQN